MLLLISTPNGDYIKNLPLKQIINTVHFSDQVYNNLHDGFADGICAAAIENFLIGNNFTSVKKDDYVRDNHICHEVADNKILMVMPSNGHKVLPVNLFLRMNLDYEG